MRVADTIQCSTIANLLLCELRLQKIPVCDDPDERDNIILASAEFILYHGVLRNTQDVVDQIKQYITDTRTNYPNYFLTGKEY